MSAVIGALRGMLSLNSAAFEKGAKRATASFSTAQKRMQATSRKMSKIGKSMSLGVTAPMIAMGTITVKRSLDAIDAQAKLAQSLGTTVKSMQVLERAGELAGVSMGEVSSISQDMTRRLSKAATGAG
ncbi:MAG: phage tail tape measure protein, partial [Sulfitobacter sp.]